MDEQVYESDEQLVNLPMPTKAGIFAGGLLATGLVDVCINGGWTGVAVGTVITYALTKESPRLIRWLQRQFPDLDLDAWASSLHLPKQLVNRMTGHTSDDEEWEEVDEDYDDDLARFEQEWEEVELRHAHQEARLVLSKTWSPLVDSFLSQRIVVLGNPGSGKSNSVAVLLEEIGPLGVPTLHLDTEDEARSLCNPRYLPKGVAVDAKRVKLENAYAFGWSILEKRLQVVLNLQSYESEDEAALVMCQVIAGMNAWEEARPSEERVSCMVILDEASVWLPQNQAESILSKTKDQEGQTTLARLQQTFFSTVVRRGRKRGIGFVLATQRIAEIDKRALQATWMILHRQNLPNDLKVYEQYGIEREAALSLGPGQAFVRGPGEFFELVQFRQRRSPDMAFTPGLASVRGRGQATRQQRPRISEPTASRIPESPEAPTRPPVTEARTSAHAGHDLTERKRQRVQRLRGSGATTAEIRESTRNQEPARPRLVVVPSPKKPAPTLDDAITIWNEAVEAGEKLSRYSLRDKLVERGFECGENAAREFLKQIRQMVNEQQSANG